MKRISHQALLNVCGGKTLSEPEATNAFMMSGSMFFPIVGMAVLESSFPAVTNNPIANVLAKATITAVGTGVGVWTGYQIYYAIYD